ncbi:MAG: VTT domain-containing protein [Opitutae bacterium]|nr:VTT domain-containing protein [Opitutae bacterium]
MSETPSSAKKALLLKLAVAAGGLGLIVVGAVACGVDLRALLQWALGLLEQVLAAVRAAGPLVFFTAMAILPGCGVPLLAFMLPVSSLFAERFGLPLVVLFSLVAITINLVLTYSLARWAFRPLLQRIVTHFGFKLPQVDSGDATDMVVLLRVTPGIPFMVQNYLCGLADVPPVKYLVVSCLAGWPAQIAFVVFGAALREGKGQTILMAAGVLVALIAATHLVRRHYGKKKAGA